MRFRLNKPIDIERQIKKELGDIPFRYSYTGYMPDLKLEDEHDEKSGSVAAGIAYVCPECGAELYAKWAEWRVKLMCNDEKLKDMFYKLSGEIRTSVKNEISEILNLTECPLCGSGLSKERGFYIEGMLIGSFIADKLISLHPTNNEKHICMQDVDYVFKYIKSQREEKEMQLSVNKVNQKISLYDNPTIASINAENRENIKNTTDKLKEYILNLIKMEVNIYSLSKRLTNLYFQEYTIKRQAYGSGYASRCEELEKCAKIEEVEERISYLLTMITRYEAGEIGIQCPVPPVQPVYKTAGFFNKKKVLAENEQMQKQYQEDMRIYEDNLHSFENQKKRMVAETENEVENLKNQIPQIEAEIELSKKQSKQSSSAFEMVGIAESEIEKAETLLQKTYECRNELYSYEIVFGKYRNIVALSAFYEYLMAGRCTVLEGADGAYNIYEAEIRADRIIDQLSQVIEKLDDIKDNQYMLYSQLKTVNTNLAHLNETMDTALTSLRNTEENIADISKNTKVIAYNSAVTAHYSKLNAELTNALGYMVAFK